ncbi:protein kinase [Streptomyces sp. NPDC059874]|uniref:protein kinase domain-containing protein n=1 Tax=Streptomyces sp. NPDC059874 TaxID=3346983 RepID=UPI00365E5304
MGDVFAQGATLAGGRYRIDGLLGSGGMAQVYKAYDLSLGRSVAIKTMLPGLALDQGLPERFRREAQAMAKLGHPNVVTVHDTGEEPRPDGPPVPYFVMELVTGPSLADRLRTAGALPVPAAVHVADQILSALEVSHERGLVHRDIKPSNILLAEGGITKVADFGIVRAIAAAGTALTGSGMMIGTAHYVSPEQARGSADLDGRSDLYAVGVLLFEMLTGRPPFDGSDVFAIALQHVNDPPPTLASYGLPGLPGLEGVLARALAKRPEDRYRDAAQMRTALRAAGAAAAAPVVAPAPPPVAAPATTPAPRMATMPLQAPVWAPPPPPRRVRVRHAVRLGACALLLVVAYGFGIVADMNNTIWMAYAMAGLAALGAFGALPRRLDRDGPPTPALKVVSWIVLCLNLYAFVIGCGGVVAIRDKIEDQSAPALSPSRSFSAMRITHTATATSSAASASSRITSTA